MVVLNPTRMRSITDAKTKFNALVSEAQAGQTAHIVSGANVVAHLVPATARIIDDAYVLTSMLQALVQREVDWIVKDCKKNGGELYSAGGIMGRVLGWAWRTDAALFMQIVSDYTVRLAAGIGRPVRADEIRALIRQSLREALTDGEIATADAHLARNWDEWMMSDVR
ncbi:hypothetical protein H7J87_27795 [Mycolicibacterium wolinskyi]|nr:MULTISPECIES: hypothetical protein [Mycolicibacterium]MCV7289136.1 hypothetical protein [Mycolicibacterium wolinskyi]MCV7297298.1 hypothetical protein [Mycolicibacterium goodii]